jgi:hypothetical protein
MAHPRSTLVKLAKGRSPLVRTLIGLLYFAALGLLIVWEFRERIELASDCDLVDSAPRSAFYTEPYRHFLDWASRDTPGQVVVLAIPLDLEDIQANLCRSRAYMADVLRLVATQHPSEIVIDKFYSPSSCAADPAPTRELVSVVQSLSIPIVIGESTAQAPSKIPNVCLVRKPQLDFGTPNVHHGLTRLNTETERVPLQWRVLPADSAAAPARVETADSLAWTAVKRYDSAYAARPRIQALIDTDRHPYANLQLDLPRQTTTALFCDLGTPAMRQRWSVQCAGPPQHLNYLGKIVLIGSENASDHRVVLGTSIFGLDLQARYIDVLLSGSYLRALPMAVSFIAFAAFVFFIEGLPTLLEAYRPRWKKKRFLCHAYTRRRYAWVIFWTLIFISTASLGALALRYLPPLAVLGDITFVAITRLLFFAAESTEAPFLHARKKGES